MQRLHGMGEGVYREVMKDPLSPAASTRPSASTATCWPTSCAACWRTARTRASCTSSPTSPSTWSSCWSRRSLQPRVLASRCRPISTAAQRGATATGVDLAVESGARAARGGDRRRARAGRARGRRAAQVAAAMARSTAGFAAWTRAPVAERAAILRRAGDLLDARLPEFCGLLVKEAHKTWGDCVAEVREAVDFCATTPTRPSAHAARGAARPDRREQRAAPARRAACSSASARGTSRWRSSPGQVAAALVAGNTVLAKPAEQTPAVAARMVAAAARGRRARRRARAAARPRRDRRRGADGRPAHRRRRASPARRRSRRSSSARSPRRTARSCR